MLQQVTGWDKKDIAGGINTEGGGDTSEDTVEKSQEVTP